MVAKIYRPAKTAMQSGQAKTKEWVLEFERQAAKRPDPLMGWTSATDMRDQISLQFDTREAAEKYAAAQGIAYRVIAPKPRRRVFKSYADNFAADRKRPWTH